MNSVTTVKARDKFAKAHLDATAVPMITKVAWGTGGVDINGDPVEPTDTQTSLVDEFIQKDITASSKLDLAVTFEATLDFNDTNALNKEVSTCGLYDSVGDLIAIKNFRTKVIDDDTRITIEWIEEF